MEPTSRESGYTLIELVIALVLISTGVIALLTALQVGIESGHGQREAAARADVAASFAAHVTAATYTCTDPAGSYAAGFVAPAGFTAIVTSVDSWNGLGVAPVTFGGSCTSGLQRIGLRVVAVGSPDNSDLVLVKRRGG